MTGYSHKTRAGKPIRVGDFVCVKDNWYGVVVSTQHLYVLVAPLRVKWGDGSPISVAARNIYHRSVPDWAAAIVMRYKLSGELML